LDSLDGWSGALNINKPSLTIISQQQHHKYTSSSQVKDPLRSTERYREAARLIGLVERVREVRQLLFLSLLLVGVVVRLPARAHAPPPRVSLHACVCWPNHDLAPATHATHRSSSLACRCNSGTGSSLALCGAGSVCERTISATYAARQAA